MILTIQLDKQHIQQLLEDFLTNLLHYVYSWLSNDGEVLGYIIGIYHVLLASVVLISALISHTLYPNIWFKLITFLSLLCVFVQHIIFNICLLIPIEERLTKKKTIFFPIIEPILHYINISVNEFISYIVVAEGFTVICFGLELVSEISRLVYNYYGIEV